MSDEIPESEQPEIIPKPPSHPITTSLLIVASIATIIAIGFVWSELFGNYLIGDKGPQEVGMDKHKWSSLKTRQGAIDHYDIDFPNEKNQLNLEFNVKQDLHIGSKFEDGGGLIPAHNVGVHVDGRFAIGESHLRYDLELANGRSADPLLIQNHHDINRPKAINLRLRYEPGGSVDGLVVGANLYFDGIPGNEMPASGSPALGPLHEWIVGAHAAYLEHNIHFIAKALLITHTELDTGTRHRSYAAFVEAGRVFDDVTPYARYEWTRFPDNGDPYSSKLAGDGYQTVSVGVKHATTSNVALKAQVAVMVPRASGADSLLTLTGQIAFAF